jgi:PAS domain-containing protein
MQDTQPKIGANALTAAGSSLVEDIITRTKANAGYSDADGTSKATEERLRLIINTMPTMVWTVQPDGAIDFVNQRWLDYTGLRLRGGN